MLGLEPRKKQGTVPREKVRAESLGREGLAGGLAKDEALSRSPALEVGSEKEPAQKALAERQGVAVCGKEAVDQGTRAQ